VAGATPGARAHVHPEDHHEFCAILASRFRPGERNEIDASPIRPSAPDRERAAARPCVARGGPRAGDHREKVPTGPRIRMRRLAFAEGNAAAGAWASYDRQSQVSGTARRSVCVGPKRPREL